MLGGHGLRGAQAVALHALRAVGRPRRAFSTFLHSLLLGLGPGKVLIPPECAQGWSLRVRCAAPAGLDVTLKQSALTPRKALVAMRFLLARLARLAGRCACCKAEEIWLSGLSLL